MVDQGSAVMYCGLLESEKLGLQPDTKHRTMVVFTAIDAVYMKRVRLDMQFIIPERKSLVNTGFSGNGEGIR